MNDSNTLYLKVLNIVEITFVGLLYYFVRFWWQCRIMLVINLKTEVWDFFFELTTIQFNLLILLSKLKAS